MAAAVSTLLTIITALIAAAVGVFTIEVLAGCFVRKRSVQAPSGVTRARAAILIPAHNESSALLPTLADIQAQMRPGDRLLVVADNCTDDTAAVAAKARAEVTTRNDQSKIGKGYALEWGIRHLSAAPPDVVIVVDADCRVAPETVDKLCLTCARTGRPAQALDLMRAPAQSSVNFQVAEFAWRVKNWARPLGLAAMGLPCQLMGTGMAFPWAIIRSAGLATEQTVEDLQLGLDLAVAGSAPVFCPEARVTSIFPTAAAAAERQRERWEHGHVGLILSRAPRLIVSAAARGNLNALALGFDLAVPPLTLLMLLVTGTLLLAGLGAWLFSATTAFCIAVANFVALVVSVALSWIRFGRDILPPRELGSIVEYVLRKFGIYSRLLSGRRSAQWTRTDRK